MFKAILLLAFVSILNTIEGKLSVTKHLLLHPARNDFQVVSNAVHPNAFYVMMAFFFLTSTIAMLACQTVPSSILIFLSMLHDLV